MSKFKYSLLAASVTLCFASQAGAASPTYDLGVVTVDGVTTPVEDLSSGFRKLFKTLFPSRIEQNCSVRFFFTTSKNGVFLPSK